MRNMFWLNTGSLYQMYVLHQVEKTGDFNSYVSLFTWLQVLPCMFLQISDCYVSWTPQRYWLPNNSISNFERINSKLFILLR